MQGKKIKRATLRDIAQVVGVSPAAVSMALNDKGNLAPKRREEIKRVAAELNYQPNSMARALRGGSSKSIGVVINFFNNAFFRSFFKGLERVTDARGFSFWASQSRDTLKKEREQVATLAEHGMDGLIVLPCSQRASHFEMVAQRYGIPVVLISHCIEDRFAAVVADNLRGARLATRHLLSLDDRPVLHVAGPPHKSALEQRRQGFCRTMAEARPDFSEERSVFQVESLRAEDGYGVMPVILERYAPPFSLFVVNDETALGVLQFCREKGLRLPEDVAVVGFSDIDILETLGIALTTVRIPAEVMGETAANILIDLMEHPEKRACPPVVTLPVSLVVRGSTVGTSPRNNVLERA
jgi:LacI family transcriptional regulator